ncbi:MAG: ImmA/IrrE family metallo-endopeptidase [Chloroflexota bacterium]
MSESTDNMARQASSLMIDRARRLVSRLIELRGHDQPPFPPNEYFNLVNIKGIQKEELGEVGAVLLRLHDGLIIKVNQSEPKVRQNFSCAHEIAHVLFNELISEHYTEKIEYRKFDSNGRDKIQARAKERLCNIAATELLMPELIFRRYLSYKGLSVGSIEPMASLFEVSIQAAAIRIAEVSLEPCIMLHWQMRQKGRVRRLALDWRVGPGTKTRARNNFAPVYDDCPSGVYKAFQSETTAKSYKLFRIDKDIKRLPLESKGFGVEDYRYVISFAYPSRTN